MYRARLQNCLVILYLATVSACSTSRPRTLADAPPLPPVERPADSADADLEEIQTLKNGSTRLLLPPATAKLELDPVKASSYSTLQRGEWLERGLTRASSNVEIYIFDMGQADAMLVVGPPPERRTLLVDAGEVGGASRKGCTKVRDRVFAITGHYHVDYFLLTHFHTDHAGGVPKEGDGRTKPYGWRWPKNRARLSIPDMESPEALSFKTLKDYLSGLLPASVSHHLQPYFDQADRKLGADFDAAIRRWPGKVCVISPVPGMIAPKVKQAVHEAVSEALLGEFMLRIAYRSVGKPLRTHRVHPLGMVLEGGLLYLVAVFDGHDDPRTLALHRMDKAERLEEPGLIPPGFSLARYIKAGGFGCGGDEVIKLDATWFHHCDTHLLQARLAADQVAEELEPGTVRVRATVRYTERLHWWLMSFGANVEVHGPSKVRKAVGAGHQEAAGLYTRPVTKPRRAKVLA